MYTRFFGLQKRPFGMTPDPAFLFLTEQHREALAGLSYALLDAKGFVVLTGEAGTGKTTLLARALQSLPKERIQFSVVLNPTLTPSEFLELALMDFGIKEVPESKAQRLAKLQNLLLEGHAAGRISALVVDEAHKLSAELLEEIRLLGNFERADRKLLQIVLAGQSELDELLNRDELWQFKQRVAVYLSIHALSATEVEQYVVHRWMKAGGTELPIPTEVIALIFRISRGIPRVINAICDNALMLAFAEVSTTVTLAHIAEAARDLRLAEPAPQKIPRESIAVPQLPASPSSLRTLERYAPVRRPSRLSRWAFKVGTAPKAETT
jgi:general secretion pathway protein A